jgi:hypothetical protein
MDQRQTRKHAWRAELSPEREKVTVLTELPSATRYGNSNRHQLKMIHAAPALTTVLVWPDVGATAGGDRR